MSAGTFSKSRVRNLAVWAICAAPVVVAFERSGNQPTQPGPTLDSRLDLGQSGPFERPREHAEAERKGGKAFTEEDWNNAKEFLSAHAPVRYAIVASVPPGEQREGLKRFLINHWRSISQLQNQSPDLYKTRVREVELDDDVFGICLELKHGRGNAKQLQSNLNAKIAELFNLGLVERKQRIGLVEKSLVDQKKLLESDEQNKAKLIEQQYQFVLSKGVEGARLDVSHHKAKPGASTTTPSPGEAESPE